MSTTEKTRQVEMLIAEERFTWYSDYFDVPCDIVDKGEEAIVSFVTKVMDKSDSIVLIAVYNIPEECDDDDY